MLKRTRARLCRKLGFRSTRKSQGTTQSPTAWREAISTEPPPPYATIETEKPVALVGEPLDPDKVFAALCEGRRMAAEHVQEVALLVPPERRAAVAAALAAQKADVHYAAAAAVARATVTPSYHSQYSLAFADTVTISAYGVAAAYEAVTEHPRSVYDLMERDGFGGRYGMGGRCLEPKV